MADFGGLDAVHANAGITGGYVTLEDLTADNWMTVLKVNLIGPFLMIKHASPIMRAAGKGSIICTASVRRHPLRRGAAALQRQQGRGHQPRPDQRQPALRHRAFGSTPSVPG